MKRGDEIEVSSDEEGLKGSWFRAILEDPLPKSGNKRLNVSLLANDGSTTLKTTYRRFLRPIPPESLFTAAAEFEEGCVVEASRGGGWWTGAVVKKINDEEVWVYFDSPPDLLQFKTGQLRQHFDWVKQKWVRPQNKVFVSKKSTFRCGTMVEVKVTDGVDVWVPSVIVKEVVNRKSFVVKPLKYISWNDEGEAPKPNRTVGLSSIRLTPPTVSVKSFGLMESVEVFIEPGWRPGMVTSILCDDMYTVCLKATDKTLVFTHDAIRPTEETIAKLVLQNTNEVSAAINPQMSLSLGENGEEEVPEEHNREDDSRKRKRVEVEHTSDLGEEGTIRKRQREHNLSSIPIAEEPQAKDTTMVLPFAKKSPFWKILETSEGFQRAPQSPHFSPLVGESKEQFREGQAIGMMVTHFSLLESFKDLEPYVSVSELNSLKASFAELKKHGFEVSAPLARISKLLALKDRQLKTMEERKGFDREIMALKEGVGEMEHKILELERQQVA